MKTPILYSFIRCPYAMRARMALSLANVVCEIREVRLSNKPKQMLEVSPKGTVPVLILEDRVIEESIEIVNWVLSSNNIFDGNLSNEQMSLTEELITIFDDKFKYHLDRYKYSSRYKNVNAEEDRSECLKILIEIENLTSKQEWFFGKKINKLDISILPFIRQFRIADQQWFDEQLLISKIQNVLFNFLESELFKDIMLKYDVWEENSTSVYFPKA
jgi:glutathione S-transferase